MLQSLEKSIYQFSSAKNYQQLKDISQALLDEEGKLRTFSAFRTAAAEINNEFVNQWLQAEYNYAQAAAQSAAQWQTIQATKDVLPLLQYKTQEDKKVRDAHIPLNDIILPVEDEFWNTYYPPNGWGCRCDVYQLDSGKLTDKSTIIYPDEKQMPEMFRYNPGKEGIAFPPEHPYYDGVPDDVKKQGILLYNKRKRLG